VELQHFPYDVQKLTISLRIDSKTDLARKRRFRELCPGGATNVKIHKSVHLTEWHLYSPCAVAGLDEGSKPVFDAFLAVRRKHEFYTSNVTIIGGALATLGMTAFVIEIEDFADRSSVVLTLLLTTVAFKFVISQDLPKVPYFTILDTYMYVAIFFLMGIAMQNAFIALVAKHAWLIDALLFLGWYSAITGSGEDDGHGASRHRILKPTPSPDVGSEQEVYENEHRAHILLDRYTASIFLVGWVLFNLAYALSIRQHIKSVKRILGAEINVVRAQNDQDINFKPNPIDTAQQLSLVPNFFSCASSNGLSRKRSASGTHLDLH